MSSNPGSAYSVRISEDVVNPYNLIVDYRYIRVPPGSSTITWNLISSPNWQVAFDNPAITFFGQNAPVTAIEAEGTTVVATWNNIAPGVSYYYRIHLVLTLPDGTTIPVSHDPVVHNESPS